MATTKKTKKGAASKNGKKRLTKAELDRQKAIKRMLWTFFFAFVLIFPVFRLGFFGVTLYNIFRVFVGSMAYPLIFAIYVYLFGFKWLRKHSNYVTGFWMVFAGLLLEFHAYLFSLDRMSGLDIFPGTKDLLFGELVSVQVARFAGGGMLGALLYQPISFLFSNIGSFMIGVLIILLGAFILSPWDVLDIMEYAKEAWQKGAEKRLERTAQRQEKKAERQAQKEREAEERAEAERLADLTVDEETGEILDDAAEALPQETEIFAPEPEISDYASEDYYDNLPPEDYEDFQEDYGPYPEDVPSEEFPPSMVVEGDDAPVEVDFTPKELLQYKLPHIDLFAPDKPKSQSREKNIVRKNIRILEDTFKSFNIDVKVERAEIGPSVTKYEVKPAVGVRVNRISNLADDLALALAAKDVRIEAPIPGKSLVGIEVPNSEIATVSFRELWEQSKTDPNKLLEVPLGKAVDGSARSFDLGRMPHLLVAGSTGSGKSTLVNLIPRFYDATEGKILVDGVNVKDYSHQELNNKVGYIPQKAVLFSGTIRSNMEFGESSQGKLEDEAIWKALELAQAKEFVATKEKGLDTEVAQGGSNFSGGQRQRLAIARALARKPEILIFDDSFSALDYKTDRILRQALKEELADTTKLIVAQRISTIMDADLILVLDQGKVVGQGTHKELLATNEVYQEIAYSQLSKEELEHA